jgi:hypothetical protein
MPRRLVSSKLTKMDALEAHDREQALRLDPAAKLVQALEVMRTGIRLKRSTLRRQNPEADEADIERRLAEWLRSDG